LFEVVKRLKREKGEGEKNYKMAMIMEEEELHIPKAEQKLENGKKVTVYHISYQGRVIYRRYSQFAALHALVLSLNSFIFLSFSFSLKII